MDLFCNLNGYLSPGNLDILCCDLRYTTRSAFLEQRCTFCFRGTLHAHFHVKDTLKGVKDAPLSVKLQKKKKKKEER